MKSRLATSFLLTSLLLLAPASALADDQHHHRTPHGDINITYEGELTRSNGIRSGRGTVKDPYVISGWAIGNISIRDTEKAIKIVDNTITGTLTLDWVGPNITVMHNDIGDLRVNQNNARWGDPTGGMIMHNTFGQVGQLRHFDGHFADNTVGTPQTGTMSSSYPETRAVNFDGFNGARFERNTIYGYVDARLHGHHHSSSYAKTSHTHAHRDSKDHTKRYHQVVIQSNRIYTSNEYALAYLDTNHAGNDRTANSETNPWLNAPHYHYTRARILSNRLTGAGLLVDVFNANDDRHKGTRTGSLELRGNMVTLEQDPTRPFRVLQGIEVRHARDLVLTISTNSIVGAPPLVDVSPLDRFQAQGAGILMLDLDKARVSITNTRITDRQFGVRALQFTRSVWWKVSGLQTDGVVEPVSYDASVANPPNA